MPNTAVAVGQSMTCYASLNASPHQEAVIQDLFGQVGQALLLPEAQLAAATALTSCGIAYALRDRKSTRLNSSHVRISYAVFCLKKKKNKYIHQFFIYFYFQ